MEKSKDFDPYRTPKTPVQEGRENAQENKRIPARSKTRKRTNVQQLTCNIDSSCSFYCLFFSFVLLALKPFF